jgi:hypothetical protein
VTLTRSVKNTLDLTWDSLARHRFSPSYLSIVLSIHAALPMSVVSALQYARSHGVAIDHRASDLLDLFSDLAFTLPSPEDQTSCSNLDLSTFSTDLTEQTLHLSQDEASLLADQARPPHYLIAWQQMLPSLHQFRRLRVEPPLLKEKHSTGIRRPSAGTTGLHVDHLLQRLPITTCPIDKAFYLEWEDIHSGRLSEQIVREIGTERLYTSREALVSLSRTVPRALSDDEHASILKDVEPRFAKRKSRARSSTPRLESQEDPIDSHSLSPHAAAQTIDNSSPVEVTTVDVESRGSTAQMKQKDWTHSDENRFSLGVTVDDMGRRRGSVQDDTSGETCPSDLSDIGSDIDETDIAKLFELHEAAQRTKAMPFGLDGTPLKNHSLHVPAPELHFIYTLPPWVEHANCTITQYLDVKTLAARLRPHVQIDRPLVLFAIPPQLMQQAVRDDIQDNGLLRKCIQGPNAVNRSEQMLYKRPGLRTMDCDLEGDEGLEKDADLVRDMTEPPLGTIPEKRLNVGTNLTDHVPAKRERPDRGFSSSSPRNLDNDRGGKQGKSRKVPNTVTAYLLDVESDSDRFPASNRKDENRLSLSPMYAGKARSPRLPVGATRRLSREDPFCRNPFASNPRNSVDVKTDGQMKTETIEVPTMVSTSDALGLFLDLRGLRFKRASQPQPDSTVELMDNPIEPTQSQRVVDPAIDTARVKLDEAAAKQKLRLTSTPMQQAPQLINKNELSVSKLDWMRTIVVETAILRRHGTLINFLETAGGDQLNIVYREMTRRGPGTSTCTGPDMILNAKTGLIITTVQALNQHHLPGQGSSEYGVVQGRVSRLTGEYDGVFVLVMAPDSQLHEPGNCASAFASFCASLSGHGDKSVTPVWVISGGQPRAIEEALNQWTWKLICRFSFPQVDPNLSSKPNIDNIVLVNDEAVWEDVLRRGGLNPMAAQIVIGALQVGRDDGSLALRKLVSIPVDQREELFLEALGPGAVERLNVVLQQFRT